MKSVERRIPVASILETRGGTWLRRLAPWLLALCAAQPLQADVDVEAALESADSVIGGEAVIGGTLRVIGGDAAAGGQWPSVVALVRVEGFYSPADRQFCGGTVVAPRWILTAAHCLYDAFDQQLDPAELRVVAGVTDLRAETATEETVVTGLYVHPEYDHTSDEAYHDIALLELGTEPEVPLVSLFTDDPAALGTTPATVVGWGATEFTTPRQAVYPDALHQATVPLVPRATCNAPDSYDGYVGTGQLCAGFIEGGVDSCVGDSGGPLFVDDGEGVRQVGVVSYGRGCAEPFYYGIYTSVSAYLAWISDYVELPGVTVTNPSPLEQQPRGMSPTASPGAPALRPVEGNGNPFALSETAGGTGDGGGGSAGGFGLALLGLAALLTGRVRRHRPRLGG